MALIIKALAASNANTTAFTLYSVTAGKSAVVYGIRLSNANASTVTTNLQVQPSNAQLPTARLYKKDYVMTSGAFLALDDPLTLGAGDIIKLLQAGPATYTMNYMVSGVERDE